jgi:hypothetical protein
MRVIKILNWYYDTKYQIFFRQSPAVAAQMIGDPLKWDDNTVDGLYKNGNVIRVTAIDYGKEWIYVGVVHSDQCAATSPWSLLEKADKQYPSKG